MKKDLGHQPVGIYEFRRRAAYWDGKTNWINPWQVGSIFVHSRLETLQQRVRC